jgi:hypothetical protein
VNALAGIFLRRLRKLRRVVYYIIEICPETISIPSTDEDACKVDRSQVHPRHSLVPDSDLPVVLQPSEEPFYVVPHSVIAFLGEESGPAQPLLRLWEGRVSVT